MAIKNGSLTDADEVMNSIGSNFVDNAQLIFNADYIGFNSKTNEQFKNVMFDTFKTDTMTKTGNALYDSTQNLYWSAPIDDLLTYTSFDEFSTGTVDAAKWTTSATIGSVTESGDLLRVVALGSSAGSGNTDTVSATSIGLFNQGQNFVFIEIPSISVGISNNTGHSGTASVLIAGNTLTALTVANSTANTSVTNSNVKIHAILIKGRIHYRTKIDTAAWSAFSSVAGSTSSEIKFNCISVDNGGGTGATTTINVEFVRFNTKTGLTTDYITSPQTTAAATITNLISTFSTNGTITNQITANNSNYENITNGLINRPTNTGTALKQRFIFGGTGYVEHFATKYNLY